MGFVFRFSGSGFLRRRLTKIETESLPHFDQTQQILSGIGVDLGRVGLIVNTHCHCDHIGGNRRIQALSGCGIALHRVGKHFIDSHDDWATWWRYYEQAAEFFTCTRGLEDSNVITAGPCTDGKLFTTAAA